MSIKKSLLICSMVMNLMHHMQEVMKDIVVFLTGDQNRTKHIDILFS